MDRVSWREGLDPWCRRWLSAAVRAERFVAGWQSAVVGLELDDGREVVVKIRPLAAGLSTRLGCHRRLWAGGFPCPQPLTELHPLGEFVASAEQLLPTGTSRPPRPVEVPELAGVLADLVRRANIDRVGGPSVRLRTGPAGAEPTRPPEYGPRRARGSSTSTGPRNRPG